MLTLKEKVSEAASSIILGDFMIASAIQRLLLLRVGKGSC